MVGRLLILVLRLNRWFYRKFVVLLFSFARSPSYLPLLLFLMRRLNASIEPAFCAKAVSFCHEHGMGRMVKVTDTGVLHLYFNEFLLAFPLSEVTARSLDLNYKNWAFLKANFNRDKLFDYCIEQGEYVGVRFYKNELLKPFSHDIKLAKDVLNKLSSNRRPVQDIFALYDLERKAKDASELLGMARFSHLSGRINSEPGDVGITHGDFHRSNLMVNDDGAVVLIDLDHLLIDGAIVFDEIHLFLNGLGGNWLDYVVLVMKGSFSVDWSDNCFVAYTIDRVSREIRGASTVHPIYRSKIRDFLTKALS